MPRIISGRFKGLRLASPVGRTTRPTADRVKEAIFSTLASLPFDFTGARVLDFFAGSGSLGLEAISRGADAAVFADQDQSALAAVRRNAAAAGLGPEAAILSARWPQGFQRLPAGPPFDLFFLDPPYGRPDLPLTLLREAVARSLAAAGALAVWEQAPSTLPAWTEAEAAPWALIKTRTWGQRAAAFLRLEPQTIYKPAKLDL